MTRLLAACLLSLAVAACGGASSAHGTTPTNTAPAPAATTFELGEMTVFDGPDAMLKIHADGSTELGGRKSEMEHGDTAPKTEVVWKPGPTMKVDGTIEWQGKAVAKLGADGTLQSLEGNLPVQIHVTGDELSMTDNGQTVTIALAADGKMTITNAPGKLHDQPPHVEGADTPGKRRTVLTLIAMMIGAGAPGTTHEVSSGPEAPAPQPAPAPAPAPTP